MGPTGHVEDPRRPRDHAEGPLRMGWLPEDKLQTATRLSAKWPAANGGFRRLSAKSPLRSDPPESDKSTGQPKIFLYFQCAAIGPIGR